MSGERGEPPAGLAGGSRARSPEGIRTLATAVRGRRPGPLDDGAVRAASILPRAAEGARRGRDDERPRPGWVGASAWCSPEGIRTLATAVRGRRPGPLDDGARYCWWCGRAEEVVLPRWGTKTRT